MSSQCDLFVAANCVQVLSTFPGRKWPADPGKMFQFFQTFSKLTLWSCSDHNPELSVNAIMEPFFFLFNMRLKQYGLLCLSIMFVYLFLYFCSIFKCDFFQHPNSGFCVFDVLHRTRVLHRTKYRCQFHCLLCCLDHFNSHFVYTVDTVETS